MRIEHVAMYPFNLDSISLTNSSFPLPRSLSSSPESKPRRDRRRTDPVGRIIRQKAFPLSLTVPAEPRTLDAMSDAELDAKLQHSYTQSVAGEGRSLGDVFDDLERSIS